MARQRPVTRRTTTTSSMFHRRMQRCVFLHARLSDLLFDLTAMDIFQHLLQCNVYGIACAASGTTLQMQPGSRLIVGKGAWEDTAHVILGFLARDWVVAKYFNRLDLQYLKMLLRRLAPDVDIRCEQLYTKDMIEARIAAVRAAPATHCRMVVDCGHAGLVSEHALSGSEPTERRLIQVGNTEEDSDSGAAVDDAGETSVTTEGHADTDSGATHG
jgi:hypothetical protein